MGNGGILGPLSDEYDAWQAQPEYGDDEVRDPIASWHENRFKYPRLSRMALDFLTIQAMSAECERMFSAAGRMVTPIRASLDAQVIGICQVVRSWLRAGIVSNKGAIEFVSLVRETDEGAENLRSSDDNVSEATSAWLLEKPSELLEEEKNVGIDTQWASQLPNPEVELSYTQIHLVYINQRKPQIDTLNWHFAD
jgi:hypothetical protein